MAIDTFLTHWINAFAGRSSVIDLLMLAITVYAAWHAWPLLEVGADQERLGTVLSEAWPTGALVLSSVFLVLFLILRIALRLAGRPVPHAAHME